MSLNIVFLRPHINWSRLTTQLLKHYYRRQGLNSSGGFGGSGRAPKS